MHKQTKLVFHPFMLVYSFLGIFSKSGASSLGPTQPNSYLLNHSLLALPEIIYFADVVKIIQPKKLLMKLGFCKMFD